MFKVLEIMRTSINQVIATETCRTMSGSMFSNALIMEFSLGGVLIDYIFSISSLLSEWTD